MTIDERLNRLEHISAGLDAEWRKRREEDRQLWRNTQMQVDASARAIENLTYRLDDTRAMIHELAEEARESDRRLGARIEAVNAGLGERIDALVSALGEFIRKSSEGK